jgi:uncharacterized RDD family membrane protein YckC
MVPRMPVWPRALLWVLIGALIAFSLWPRTPGDFTLRFHLAGNRTNLYVAKTATPPADDPAGRSARLVYSQMDSLGKWSKPVEGRGNVLHFVAWQEDLAALFSDGGMFAFGPSKMGYVSPPRVAAADDGDLRLRWWLTATSDGPTLDVLGLGTDNRVLSCRRGAENWGDLLPVDLKVDWSREDALTMASAMLGDQLHVVWLGSPVAEMLAEDESAARRLMFARRTADGSWQGPYEESDILLVGPPQVVPFGDRLAMVCLKPAEKPSAEDVPPVLVYAEYTPADGRWHAVRDIALPRRDDDQTHALAGYGLVPFADGHVLGVGYRDGNMRLYQIDLSGGRLQPMDAPPEFRVAPQGAEQEDIMPNWLFLAMLLFAVLVFLAGQMAQRRALEQRLAEGSISNEEVARMISTQVERLMYLPVLLRRGGAAAIDFLISGVLYVAVLVVFLLPATSQSFWEYLAGFWDQSSSEILAAQGIHYLTMVGYYIFFEIIWRRSPGKRILGLRVVTLSDGRPEWWRMIVRNLLRPVDYAFGIGLFAVVWSRRNQSLGDMAAGTRVVRAQTDTGGGPQDDDTRSA